MGMPPAAGAGALLGPPATTRRAGPNVTRAGGMQEAVNQKPGRPRGEGAPQEETR